MKSRKLTGVTLLVTALLLAVASLAAFIAVFRALLVPSTLVALESAFGSLVVALLLLVLAGRAWRAGRLRLAQRQGDSLAGNSSSGSSDHA